MFVSCFILLMDRVLIFFISVVTILLPVANMIILSSGEKMTGRAR